MALPREMWEQVLSFLTPGELAGCWEVSPEWGDLAESDHLWRQVCQQYGYNDTIMVDDYPTHLPHKANSCEGKCKWRLNFERNQELPLNWETGKSLRYEVSPPEVESGVTCIDCDGVTLAAGHSNGTLSLFSVKNLPRHLGNVNCILSNYGLVKVKINGRYVVAVQVGLVQIYSLDKMSLVDAKTFDLGFYNVDACGRLGLNSPGFPAFYSATIGPDKKQTNRVFIHMEQDRVYVAVRDFQVIYCWEMSTGVRLETIHLRMRDAKLREMVGGKGGGVWVRTATSRGVRHLCRYHVEGGGWGVEAMSAPQGIKVQRVLVGGGVVGGVGAEAVAVWEAATGALLAVRTASTYVPSGAVCFTPLDDVLLAEGTLVTLWDPRNDVVLKKVSLPSPVSFLAPGPYRFFFSVHSDYVCVTDWASGKLLYKIRKGSSTSKELLWADKTMVFNNGINGQIQMIAYC